MELNERKLRILQAIVSDFIHSAEPVGSRTLAKNYDMGISPATIRNEMSDLEEMGYLTHPHTSAGRVPSDKAYRMYVDELMKKKDLSPAEKSFIAERISGTVSELEKVAAYAASLLSELTNLTAFATTPVPKEDKLRYVNLLPADERTVVLMIVSESGKVSNTVLRLNEPYTEENLQLLSKVMTHNYKGKALTEIRPDDIVEQVRNDMTTLSGLAADIAPNFMTTLERMLNEELYVDGLTNIFSIPEYSDIEKARLFMEKMNRKKDFTDVLNKRDNGLEITIGDENDDEALKDCTLITATYHVNGKMVGRIGVIGPTRMAYDEVSSVIEYLTDNLNRTFALTEGDSNTNE